MKGNIEWTPRLRPIIGRATRRIKGSTVRGANDCATGFQNNTLSEGGIGADAMAPLINIGRNPIASGA